jgi:hypothetical protein
MDLACPCVYLLLLQSVVVKVFAKNYKMDIADKPSGFQSSKKFELGSSRL